MKKWRSATSFLSIQRERGPVFVNCVRTIDRLLLGLKGTMSEAELHVLKQRMHGGKLSKARRGELAFPVPTGYVRRPSGEVVFDPDEEVQQVVALVFRKFEELRTLNSLLRYLVRNGVKLRRPRPRGRGQG
jgi:DNA invertase Pin-like site-specific DNA recombinase